MDEDDDSKILQPQKTTIVQITKTKTNNNDEAPEKSLGLRTKSILTQVSTKSKSLKITYKRKCKKVTYFVRLFAPMSQITTQLKYNLRSAS